MVVVDEIAMLSKAVGNSVGAGTLVASLRTFPLQLSQSGAHLCLIAVVVDVTVDEEVEPVTSHLVMGAPHTVVQTSPCARLFGPPLVVVAVAVHAMLQLLTVVKVHVEEEVCVGSSVSDTESDGSEASSGTTSLRASSNGLRSSCKPLTVFTAAVVPPITASFTLLVVSMTQLTSENAVLNNPPSKSRSLRTSCNSWSRSLLRRFPDPHGSTPSVGFGNLAKKPTAWGRMLFSSSVTSVT